MQSKATNDRHNLDWKMLAGKNNRNNEGGAEHTGKLEQMWLGR